MTSSWFVKAIAVVFSVSIMGACAGSGASDNIVEAFKENQSVQPLPPRLQRLDRDNDNRLTKNEAPPLLSRNFAEIDRNSDRFLNTQEIVMFMRGGAPAARGQASGERPKINDRRASLDEIQPILASIRGASGAVLIVKEFDGSVMYESAAGDLSLDDSVPIASATKWVAAAMLMMLVDEGRLDIDAPASAYAPYLVDDKAAITLRQLFSHTSGMSGDHAANTPVTESLQQVARRLAREPLVAEPGASLRYGGVSMQIAGAIMEGAAQKSFQAYFLEQLATPLGMSQSYFCHPRNCNIDDPMDATNPLVGGGMISSASDMIRFLDMIAGGGEVDGVRHLSLESLEEMRRVVTEGLSRDGLPLSAGPGWQYGVGQWRQYVEPGESEGISHSAGAFGAYPWIDWDRSLYGIFLTEARLPAVYPQIEEIRMIVENVHDQAR
ncbi:MAG: beta-lactamase family protein [Clostridia bacterium]|nr:beta-lactamase family protein [Clostridia bacterium]